MNECLLFWFALNLLFGYQPQPVSNYFVCLEHDLVYFSKNHNKHWERRRVNAKAGEQRHLLPSVMVSILVTPG